MRGTVYMWFAANNILHMQLRPQGLLLDDFQNSGS